VTKSYRMPKRIIDIHNHLPKDGPEAMLDRMDDARIDVALVMGSPRSAEVGNRALVRACHRHPDRFVGGACYDPREGKRALAKLKRYNAEGLRVVKLFPNLGYFPDEAKLRPFWDRVAELGMGVLSHCGWLGGSGDRMTRKPWAAYYSHPGRFEKVVRLYPDTVFILAHFGGIAGVLESVMLTTRTPNVYVDCSPGQGLWAVETCGAVAGTVPPGKLMWGADSQEQKTLIGRYRRALVGLGFGAHLDKVFYSNARGILEKLGVFPTG